MANDRNEKARQEFAAVQARRQFIQAVASGQTGAADRFGAIIGEGDSLLFIAPATGYIWQVKAIDTTDPRVPLGQVKIKLVCEVEEIVPVGRPLREMLRVLTKQAEIAPALNGEADQQAGPSEADVAAMDGPPVEIPPEEPHD